MVHHHARILLRQVSVTFGFSMKLGQGEFLVDVLSQAAHGFPQRITCKQMALIDFLSDKLTTKRA
jgi:hypothetical protein